MDGTLQDIYAQNVTDLRNFFNHERFRGKIRHYTPEDIAPLRNSFKVDYPISSYMAFKLYNNLRERYNKGEYMHTFGALDPVQVINLGKYLDCLYVSGWQCSSTASTTNEPGPDFADYPVNTVPNKVDQLVKAQLYHDRRQSEERSRMSPEERKLNPARDYLAPCVADADAGFGGTLAVMKLVKMFVEAGAGGIHIEDQRHGTKKCGHMAGKVIVSTRDHVNRLIAVRLQADIMNVPLVICARTDALSAKFLDSNIDARDHPFILGVYDSSRPDDLVTFPEAGEKMILKSFTGREQSLVLQKWRDICYDCSLQQAQKLAIDLGFQLYFDWDACRSYEGYFRVKGSVLMCVRRCKEYSNYADLLWMETPKPNLKVAKEFAEGVRVYHPEQMFAYNLSPSFNWDASGMTDNEIGNFCGGLGRMGYCYQFITLAGFHINALSTEIFARRFAEQKMIAYVRDVQRKERIENVDQLKHQK